MRRSRVAFALTIGLSLLASAPVAGAHESSVAGRSGSAQIDPAQPRGVGPGVEVVMVPDVAAAQKLLGSSDRVESGNVNAYVATYSPEVDAGYYAVTKDQAISATEASDRLSALQTTDASAASTGHQTILVFSRFTRDQIDQSIATLTESIGSAKADAAFYYDPATDSILLGINLAASPSVSIPQTTVPITLSDGDVGDAYYRENMPAPFRGGGTIYDVGLRRCTSGIPAYNASGTPGYFTAAHCFSLSSWVFASSSLAGGSNTGKVSHRYGTAAVDAEFVSGKTYTGRIYTGTSLSISKPIVGTYFPAAGVGNRLCFSGSTTGVQCGNSLITYSGSFCGDTGCNSDLLALRGGVATEPGDSGGPVYANFADTGKVSGIVRGYYDPFIGESTTFAVDWRKIANTYAATLMYG